MADIIFGTFGGNAILNAIFNATVFSVTTPYLSLHTAAPGIAGSNEATGGSYARQNTASDWPVAASKTLDNDNLIEWTGLAAGTYSHVGVWDAASGGNYVKGGALASSVVVGASGAVQIAAGDIDWTMD